MREVKNEKKVEKSFASWRSISELERAIEISGREHGHVSWPFRLEPIGSFGDQKESEVGSVGDDSATMSRFDFVLFR